jgi:hypothetical protein
MLPTYLSVNFIGAKAYLCREKYIPLESIAILFQNKAFINPASWLLKIKYFDAEKSELFAEIVEYRNAYSTFSEEQLLCNDLLKKVSNLKVRSIDTANIIWQLKGNNEGEVRLVKIKPDYTVEEAPQEYAENLENLNNENDIHQNITFYPQIFSIPFKKVFFSFGCVKTMLKLQPFNKVEEIRIINPDIRSEFEAVKNYFAKALNLKTVNVNVKLELKDGDIYSISAYSEEISKINAQLIESVRFELVQTGLRKKVSVDIDKNLFTADEFFDRFGMDKLGFNAFYDDSEAFMSDVLKVVNAKHYKNLVYLSARHAHHILKLRFVLDPFSFIFLLEGEKKYHLIWETFDTAEATWHWSVEKNMQVLKLTLQKIEEIIQLVKVQGKTAYIGSADEPFRRIIHDYSNISEGFYKWKSELESYLY